MNLRVTIPTAFLACLMAISMFASCTIAVAEATPPTWEEGDAWAMGFERDLGAEFADEISNIEQALQGLADVELENFDADGNAAFYLVFEVTEETATNYILTGDMGQKLEFSLNVQLSAMLPDEGTYGFGDEPQMSEKTITVDASIDYALWVHAEAEILNPSMALESISIEIHGSAEVHASVENFPNIANDEGEMSVNYENMDIWIALDVDIAIDIDFEPALDIFQFPFDVGDAWTVMSNATISGTLDGYLDSTGLPAEATQELFSDPVMVANGITGFPIELDQLTIDEEDGPQISNGVLEPSTVPIEFDLACIGSDLVTLPNWGLVQVYTLETSDGERFRYSPDIKFMTNMEVDFEQLFGDMGADIPVDIPDVTEFVDEDEMTMGSVSATTALSNIQEIADYQGSVIQGEDTSDGGDMNDFFFKEPYFGIIILVLVVIVVISVVFVVVKRK